MAYGTTLPKGARVTTSRDAHPASRVFKRALICGLNSTGVVVRDLRVASSAVNRFEVKNGNTQGGMHVRISPWDPEMVQIQVFEPPGVQHQREAPEGHREVLRPPGLPPRLLQRVRRDPVPRPGDGDVRSRTDAHLGRRAHPQPRLPPRDRLLVLGGVARSCPASSAASTPRSSRCAPSPTSATRASAPRSWAPTSPTCAPRRGDERRHGARHRPGRRTAVRRRRPGGRGAGREGSPAVRASSWRSRPARERRSSCRSP